MINVYYYHNLIAYLKFFPFFLSYSTHPGIEQIIQNIENPSLPVRDSIPKLFICKINEAEIES